MLDTPYITRTDPVQAAVIRLDIPRAEIVHVMGPGMAELLATTAAQGVGPAGRCYSHHFSMQSDRFDFEIGVPVSAPVTPAGRVQPGVLPAARVARAVLHGPYDALPGAWGQLMAWIEAQGLSKAPGLWEVYVSGPDLDPDPSTWRTELNQPLTD
ncbi:AraC family transcriptional regulator [Massilia violaceinigra]|uniref:AraC family transcriptional regulator n=1 Tax=Massilia violaceinigra TaxID=2045208 RepID=A0A2D2DDP0_9BURK|nr:GyrI-like domain-containing protein [Massilia violaceinigra]ATQ73095.1 AraC family transcriptional regulator [Massilia violaceinigra]